MTAARTIGPGAPNSFSSTNPNGAADSAPAAATRPSRAFACISPSSGSAYAIVRPFFVIACTFDATRIASASGNSSNDSTFAAATTATTARASAATREIQRRGPARSSGDHEERPGQRERQHREPEVQRHLHLRLVDGQGEEDRVGERDRDQRVAGRAREVHEPVRVQRA